MSNGGNVDSSVEMVLDDEMKNGADILCVREAKRSSDRNFDFVAVCLA